MELVRSNINKKVQEIIYYKMGDYISFTEAIIQFVDRATRRIHRNYIYLLWLKY